MEILEIPLEKINRKDNSPRFPPNILRNGGISQQQIRTTGLVDLAD